MIRRVGPAEAETIVRLYNDGLSVREIAERVGRGTPSSIYRYLHRAGIPLMSDRPTHFGGPLRFSPEEERELAAMYASGATLAKLRRTFGNAADLTLASAIKRQGGTLRRVGYTAKTYPPEQVADMVARWHSGQSQTEIARAYGTSQGKISATLIHNGIQPVTRLAIRARHRSWKGGRKQLRKGYVAVRVEQDSPFKSMCIGKGPYIPEHRLRVAESLGRPLTNSETVHHINGVKTDNRLENLQLRSSYHGTGVAMCCADCGSTNVVPVRLA